MGQHDTIDRSIQRKFDIIQKLGQGAYGVVWKAVDRKTRETVALKKVFDAFQNSTDAQRTFREIMFLQELNSHENIIKLFNVYPAENDKDIYMTFEYMETDLHAVIRAGILEPVHKQYVIYQLLKALNFMHTGNILHRDMKPSNLLLNSDCLVKVCDFGLARTMDGATGAFNQRVALTDYVATRWYRAPEILMGSHAYTKAVDTWSIGCVLGEMMLGKPIFPGSSTLNQLERIVEVTGKPDRAGLASMKSSYAKTMIDSLPNVKRKSLTELLPKADRDALDFIARCLRFNPNERMTAAEGLNHPFVAQFHNTSDEPVWKGPHIKFCLDDNTKYSVSEYRNRLYKEVARRKRAVREAVRGRMAAR
jgi:mitogen-activated protein kinase 15